MIRRLGPRQALGDGEDPALDFGQAVNAGFAIVLVGVDDFDRAPVEHRGYVARIEPVLDEVASRFSSSHSKAIGGLRGGSGGLCQYICNGAGGRPALGI
jgi:hypothetical protein